MSETSHGAVEEVGNNNASRIDGIKETKKSDDDPRTGVEIWMIPQVNWE